MSKVSIHFLLQPRFFSFFLLWPFLKIKNICSRRPKPAGYKFQTKLNNLSNYIPAKQAPSLSCFPNVSVKPNWIYAGTKDIQEGASTEQVLFWQSGYACCFEDLEGKKQQNFQPNLPNLQGTHERIISEYRLWSFTGSKSLGILNSGPSWVILLGLVWFSWHVHCNPVSCVL